ncbi:SHOCT-like domain-containing protein [Inconstantimicrobium mannanitabidum]|uniref:Uncharacterized protein n=1 Tax=Inconstantimicrobium mannanitabidum TaxID=1604901 RepID=A0ACB5RIK4_9CLOT|nr:hypothetical protein [Clostridium sp. TW13]GKX68903.1 hypothetical protein rsdtw13_41610 [Clostridium sp. TW13]
MKEERQRILKMLAEGKIDEEQAEKLLDALSNGRDENDTQAIEVSNVKGGFEEKYSIFRDEVMKKHSNMLLIFVSSKEGENVRIKFPMSFVKLMIKAAGKENINLNGVNIDREVLQSAIDNDLKGRIVDIDSNDGDNVIIEII